MIDCERRSILYHLVPSKTRVILRHDHETPKVSHVSELCKYTKCGKKCSCSRISQEHIKNIREESWHAYQAIHVHHMETKQHSMFSEEEENEEEEKENLFYGTASFTLCFCTK